MISIDRCVVAPSRLTCAIPMADHGTAKVADVPSSATVQGSITSPDGSRVAPQLGTRRGSAIDDVRHGPVRHRLTVADHYRIAEAGILGRRERVEFIDGEIIDMSPIGGLHAAVVNVLARHVGQCLGDAPFVSIQNPIRLDDENEPEPDLLIPRLRSPVLTARQSTHRSYNSSPQCHEARHASARRHTRAVASQWSVARVSAM
ncbi:hypothetical protein EBR04_08190 [bacterium]|nr:hypothetical protein [bacterium]